MKTTHPPTDSLERYPEIMSPGARSRAFDADADGAGDGEGGAVLLGTTLERALAEGDHVYAVIAGSAVRHNGTRSATFTAPSSAAQAETIMAAWRAAGLDPADAGYVETHGSGTRLGDAVELEGLHATPAARHRRGADRLGQDEHRPHRSRGGHRRSGEGDADLHHRELYPSLHFTRPPAGVEQAPRPASRWSPPPGRGRVRPGGRAPVGSAPSAWSA